MLSTSRSTHNPHRGERLVRKRKKAAVLSGHCQRQSVAAGKMPVPGPTDRGVRLEYICERRRAFRMALLNCQHKRHSSFTTLIACHTRSSACLPLSSSRPSPPRCPDPSPRLPPSSSTLSLTLAPSTLSLTTRRALATSEQPATNFISLRTEADIPTASSMSMATASSMSTPRLPRSPSATTTPT